MALLELCPNPTTEWLRDTYRATPIIVPEERYKPLMLMSYNGREAKFIGELKHLFIPGGPPFDIKARNSGMADTSLDKTKSVNIKMGLDILNGFFKSLKMDPVAISSAFNHVREISLSFRNVKRNYIDLLELGNLLSQQTVNMKNPVLNIFSDDDNELLLITDAMMSKGFGINDHTKKDGDLQIDIPLIEKYLADAKLKVKFDTDKKSSISFEGARPLSFAFSCAKLKIDEATGTLSVAELMDAKSVTKSFKPVSKAEKRNQLVYKPVLSEEKPVMIGFTS